MLKIPVSYCYCGAQGHTSSRWKKNMITWLFSHVLAVCFSLNLSAVGWGCYLDVWPLIISRVIYSFFDINSSLWRRSIKFIISKVKPEWFVITTNAFQRSELRQTNMYHVTFCINHSSTRDADLNVVIECLKKCRYLTIETRPYTRRSAEYSEIVI